MSAPAPMFGPYRLVSQVGEGGMGSVYLAVRADQQFDKKVAIKFATGALQNQEVLVRFRLERQTLARLEHPNIVRCLDGGTTPEGIPYLVMDHVDGMRVDEYVEKHHLPIRERIELFRRVCSAVHYAHQHLVIHRDIKPGNILVNEEDGEPKLLDFGIAKLLDDSAPIGITAAGLAPMTLHYASPEQVRGDHITVASDLYSLGVLLYELLAHHSPHYEEGISVQKLMYRILNDDPAPPSTVAPDRGRIEGDLDAIVVKALRKQPADRYASVADFSEDLGRYLSGRPVLARHGTWSYHARKFIGRHKIGVGAGTVLAVALVAAMGGMVWQWRAASIARNRADARFQDAQQLAKSMLFDVETAIERVPGSGEPRILMLSKISEYLERLRRDSSDSTEVLLDIGEAYLKLATLQASSYEDTTGDIKQAESILRKAIATEESILRVNPDHRQALDITARARVQLSDILASMGRIREAVVEAGQAARLFSQIARRDPHDTRALRDAGVAYLYLAGVDGSPGQLNMGNRKRAIDDTREAIADYDKVLALGPNKQVERTNKPVATALLAYLLAADGNFTEARQMVAGMEAARGQIERLGMRAAVRDILGNFDGALARVLQRLGKQQEAALYLNEAVEFRRETAEADPSNGFAQFELAAGLYDLGVSTAALGAPEAAKKEFQEAAEQLQKLVKREPNNLEWLNQLADAFLAEGDREDAIPLAKRLAERADTTPDELIRYARLLGASDPNQAVRIAHNASVMTNRNEWEVEDAYAKICADADDWAIAVEAEARALTLVDGYGPNAGESLQSTLRERLDRYRERLTRQ